MCVINMRDETLGRGNPRERYCVVQVPYVAQDGCEHGGR